MVACLVKNDNFKKLRTIHFWMSIDTHQRTETLNTRRYNQFSNIYSQPTSLFWITNQYIHHYLFPPIPHTVFIFSLICIQTMAIQLDHLAYQRIFSVNYDKAWKRRKKVGSAPTTHTINTCHQICEKKNRDFPFREIVL